MNIFDELKGLPNNKDEKAFAVAQVANLAVSFNTEAVGSREHDALAHAMFILFKLNSFFGVMPEIVSASDQELTVHVSYTNLQGKNLDEFKLANLRFP